MRHVVRLAASAVAVVLLAACSGTPDAASSAQTPTSSAPLASTPESTTPSVTPSTAPTTPPDPTVVLAASQTACSGLADRLIESEMTLGIGYYDEMGMEGRPDRLHDHVHSFKAVTTSTADPAVNASMLAFNRAAQLYGAIPAAN